MENDVFRKNQSHTAFIIRSLKKFWAKGSLGVTQLQHINKNHVTAERLQGLHLKKEV